jgi:putative copper resistance protein D
MFLSIIIDFLHILATVTWVGGMLYLHIVVNPSLTVLDPPLRGKLMGAINKRFPIFAWLSVILLLITGILKTPSGMFMELSTTYGIGLLIKHFLFFIMIIIGILISFIMAPKMESLVPKPGEAPSSEFVKVQKQVALLAMINLILGILALICTALII